MNTQQQIPFKILLIGDNGIDQYQYGTVNRISPEAPVPIINYTHTETKSGMAANVKTNLEALGCLVDLVHGNKTSVKTRIIDSRSKQQLIRIDQDLISKPVKVDFLTINTYDAVVVSDYNKGSVDYKVLEQIRHYFEGPIFIDTKKTDLAKLEGFIIKINSKEFLELTTTPSDNTDLIVTYGAQGATWKNKIYPVEQVEVSDVCGAGDTFLAALAYGYLKYNNFEDAIKFAIRASAITVQHIGVYAPTLEEIQ
jgi:D-beta-D-heptose 7-phosphate kinase/D-beta-D-heptose 1-phosphate adenosyltransferase